MTHDRPRLLVVDDEAPIRTFAERLFEDAGYDVTVASDGPEALRLLETQGPFDLFVLDVMMPQMRGDELARQVRKREPHAKVLYFTGYSSHLFQDRQTLSEHDTVIEKPATVEALLDSVSFTLRPPRAEQRTAPGVEELVQTYYRSFNERRINEAAVLFAPDANLEHVPFGSEHHGPHGYLAFAAAWLSAFPDATFAVQRVDHRSDSLYEVHLLSTGHHRGTLDIGFFKFKPTGVEAVLRIRELLDIRDGQIHASSMTFDMNDLVGQLSIVDYTELAARLSRLVQLAGELTDAAGDAARQRDVADRLGPQLDAARRALRPHYNR